jgi:hypothetical protein
MPPICTSMLAKFYSCKKQVLHLEGSSMDNGIVLLSESSSWMDIFDVLASGMIVFGGGGHGQGLLQFLELYGCHEPVSHLAALLVAVIGVLDVSPDGDDTMRS